MFNNQEFTQVDPRLAMGARIHYTGDMANCEGEGTLMRVNTDGKFYPRTYDIKMDDGREFRQILPNSFEDSPGRRFWLLDDWNEKRLAEVRSFYERYGIGLQEIPPSPVPAPSRFNLPFEE